MRNTARGPSSAYAGALLLPVLQSHLRIDTYCPSSLFLPTASPVPFFPGLSPFSISCCVQLAPRAALAEAERLLRSVHDMRVSELGQGHRGVTASLLDLLSVLMETVRTDRSRRKCGERRAETIYCSLGGTDACAVVSSCADRPRGMLLAPPPLQGRAEEAHAKLVAHIRGGGALELHLVLPAVSKMATHLVATANSSEAIYLLEEARQLLLRFTTITGFAAVSYLPLAQSVAQLLDTSLQRHHPAWLHLRSMLHVLRSTVQAVKSIREAAKHRGVTDGALMLDLYWKLAEELRAVGELQRAEARTPAPPQPAELAAADAIERQQLAS